MSEIRKQYLELLVARGVALVVGFLSSFVFVKYMSPETFGQYKYITNYYTTLSTFAVLGIPYTASRLLVQTDDAGVMRKIYGFTTKTLTIFSLALSAVIVVILLLVRRGGSEIPTYLIVLTPFFYTVVLQTSFQTMLQGSNQIRDISLQTLLPPLLLLLVIWGFGLGLGVLDIYQVMIIYIVIYTLLHLLTIRRLKVDFRPIGSEMRVAFAEEFRTNGLPIYVGSLIGVASGYVINLIVGALSGMEEYGLFGLAISISSPMQFIPSVMGTVSFRANAKSNRLTRNNLLFTVLISLGALVLYIGFLHLLFPLYPGDYADALPYTIVLSIYFTAMGLGDYFNRFVSAHGFGRMINLGAVVTGLTNIVASYFLIKGYMVTGAVWARAISGVAYLSYMIWAYVRVTRQLTLEGGDS